jgi:hypothetical protein
VHLQGCRCAIHDLEPRQCSEIVNGERCERVCRGRRALGSHVSFVHKRRQRKMQPLLIPTGTGYLQAALRDPQARSRLDVSALPRFSQTIMRAPRMGKWSRSLARGRLREARENPEDLLRYGLSMPGTIAEVVVQLALEADVPISAVVLAVLSLGFEAIAKELRNWKTLPIPPVRPPKLVGDAMAQAVEAPRQTLPQGRMPLASAVPFT